jgi:hypothetical protein
MIDCSTISTSSQLQKYFDKYGAETYQFSKNQKIAVDSRMSVDGAYVLKGRSAYADMPIFKLNPKVSEKDFGIQEAILTITGSGAAVEGIRFNGNDANQIYERGDGYHNFIKLYKTSGFRADLLYVEDSLGDGIRAQYADDSEITRMRVHQCGHDGIYLQESKNVIVAGCVFHIRTNCATRFRACENAQFYNNWVENQIHTGISTGPGLQLENSTTKTTAKTYSIFNNYFKNTDGPGIWVINTYATSPNAATDLNIYQNTFESCGQGGPYKNVTSTGGICIDGWKAGIYQNLFKDCRSGVTVGPWISITPAGTGYDVTVKNNMFSGCVAGKQVYSSAGTGIDKTTKVNTTVTCSNNLFYKNKKDYFGTGETTQVNPELVLSNGLYVIGSNSAANGRGIGAKDVLYTYESTDAEKVELNVTKILKVRYSEKYPDILPDGVVIWKRKT